MSITIAKEFRWEMGHRLPFHQGGCQNLHGHSYNAVVELVGEVDDRGMVCDYGDVSAVVKPILAAWDHSFMVDESDELVRSFLADSGLKTTLVSAPSTAENIARWLLDLIVPHLASPGLEAISVTVHETATSSARADWRRI